MLVLTWLGGLLHRRTGRMIGQSAGVALAVHRIVPNRQNATSTGVYARVLVGAMIAFALLGLTQRFWRRMRPTRWNFPIAAVFNLLHWFVSSAPIAGVGILLLCAWELITLKFNLLPLTSNWIGASSRTARPSSTTRSSICRASTPTAARTPRARCPSFWAAGAARTHRARSSTASRYSSETPR